MKFDIEIHGDQRIITILETYITRKKKIKHICHAQTAKWNLVETNIDAF